MNPCGAGWKEGPLVRILTVMTCKEYRPRRHGVAMLMGANGGVGNKAQQAGREKGSHRSEKKAGVSCGGPWRP